MNQFICSSCNPDLDFNQDNQELFFCKSCLSKIKLYSRSYCKKLHHNLDNYCLNRLKYVIVKNIKYYLSTDLDYLIKNLKQIRKEILQDELKKYKLEFNNYGDSYLYIHYGQPSIDYIIKNELKKNNEKTERKIRLSKYLSEINLPLDESLDACYDYINNIGSKNIKETVRAIEIEYFLKYKTDYLNIKNIYQDDIAKDIAIKKYFINLQNNYNNQDCKIKNFISEDFTVSFE
jgi:hypothetical protein